jgi:hypothetical protein
MNFPNVIYLDKLYWFFQLNDILDGILDK